MVIFSLIAKLQNSHIGLLHTTLLVTKKFFIDSPSRGRTSDLLGFAYFLSPKTTRLLRPHPLVTEKLIKSLLMKLDASRRRQVPAEGRRRRLPRTRLGPPRLPQVRGKQDQGRVRVGVQEVRVLVNT